VSGRVRCTNGQGQAPNMGANGTNMAFLIVFTLTGRREEFPARGAPRAGNSGVNPTCSNSFPCRYPPSSVVNQRAGRHSISMVTSGVGRVEHRIFTNILSWRERSNFGLFFT